MNVCKRLRKRSVDESYTGERFISNSYFTPDMLTRMKVESRYDLDDEELGVPDSVVTCLDWCHDGSSLVCGQFGNSFQVLHPFGESPHGKKIDLGPYFPVCVSFMTCSNNIFAACLQQTAAASWVFANTDHLGDHVKIFDLERTEVVREYTYFGSAKKVRTAPFQPNKIWFDMKRSDCLIGEADIREPGFEVSEYVISREKEVSCLRDFDLSLADNNLVAVADYTMVGLFDRRMVAKERSPVLLLDSLIDKKIAHEWYVSNVKFHPNGKQLVVNCSQKYNFEHQVFIVDLQNGSKTSMKVPPEVRHSHMRLKNPCFLGPSGRYLMLDLCLNNYSVVFDCAEGKYIGNLKAEANSLPILSFNTFSKPHPEFLLVAVADRFIVNLITPTI